MTRPVHYCGWAAHGDIVIACDEATGRTGARSAWVQPTDLPEGVYEREDELLYTFERSKATCKDCIGD